MKTRSSLTVFPLLLFSLVLPLGYGLVADVNDILLGRQKVCRENGGNTRLQEMVEERLLEYEAAPLRLEHGEEGLSKTDIIHQIVTDLRTEGRRFLRKNQAGSNDWTEVSPEQAHQKVKDEINRIRRKRIKAMDKLQENDLEDAVRYLVSERDFLPYDFLEPEKEKATKRLNSNQHRNDRPPRGASGGGTTSDSSMQTIMKAQDFLFVLLGLIISFLIYWLLECYYDTLVRLLTPLMVFNQGFVQGLLVEDVPVVNGHPAGEEEPINLPMDDEAAGWVDVEPQVEGPPLLARQSSEAADVDEGDDGKGDDEHEVREDCEPVNGHPAGEEEPINLPMDDEALGWVGVLLSSEADGDEGDDEHAVREDCEPLMDGPLHLDPDDLVLFADVF